MRNVWLGVLTAVCTSACVADDPESPDVDEPGLGEDLFAGLRDGKYDGAGHPLNAAVTELEQACANAGVTGTTAIALRSPCQASLVGSARSGQLVINTRLRVRSLPANASSASAIATVTIQDSSGVALATRSLTRAEMRGLNQWQDVHLEVSGNDQALTLRIEPAAGARLVVDYAELFPKRFGLVLGPGASVLAERDQLTVETSKAHRITKVVANEADITARWLQLQAAGTIVKQTTDFRQVWTVAVADLLPARADTVQLRIFADSSSDREVVTSEIRRAQHACVFEGGAPGAKRVLVTGFQPFPADARHQNVSAVAVNNLNIAQTGASVMRVILPVEYDRAAAIVRDLVVRCQPDAVVSFGQGSGSIALEQTAYNLKDAPSFPDNRGIEYQGAAIKPDGEAEVGSSLPLTAIGDQLDTIGEHYRMSTDPGRYICNNVFYVARTTLGDRGQAGFVHLPYTTFFDDAVNQRFGQVATAVVTAVARS